MKPVRFEDLEIFVCLADQTSFSATARALNLSPVVVSNAIRRLEECLGARLIARTTRSFRLTNEGHRYLEHACSALQAMEDGENAVAPSGRDFNGRLSLSLPSDFGRNHLLGWIDEFLADRGGVDVHISIGDSLTNLNAKPVDLAIRYGVPHDSGLVYIPICENNTRILCASPDYLARHDPLRDVSQLGQHSCLRFKIGDAVYSRWVFGKDGSSSVSVHGSHVTDDSELVRRWAIAGLGIAYKSELDIADDLRAGRLRRVLPHLKGETIPLGLLAVHRTSLTPGVIALVEALRIRCREHLEQVR